MRRRERAEHQAPGEVVDEGAVGRREPLRQEVPELRIAEVVGPPSVGEVHVRVPAIQRAAGGAPRIGVVGIPVGLDPGERRVAQALDHPVQALEAVRARPGVRLDPEDPERRHDVLHRSADLRALRVLEGLRGEQLLQHRHDRRVVLAIRLRELGDETRRRRVRDEALAELVGDAMGGRGMMGEVVDVVERHGEAFVGAGVLRGPSQHLHVPDVVVVRLVVEGAVIHVVVPMDAEPREDQGRRVHLVLGVARIHADGVELEQLAPVVLVRVVLRGLGVVEVGHHRRVGRRGGQHVRELAQGVAPDHIAVVVVTRPPHVVARVGHVQVVRPEVDHHLEQLALAPRRAHDRHDAELLHQLPGTVQRAVGLLEAHREVREARGDELRQRPVVDAVRVQLLVEPGVGAHLVDLLGEAWRRTPRGAPEHVEVGVLREERGGPGRRGGGDPQEVRAQCGSGDRRPHRGVADEPAPRKGGRCRCQTVGCRCPPHAGRYRQSVRRTLNAVGEVTEIPSPARPEGARVRDVAGCE